MRLFSLFISLAFFWLLLSGHTGALLLSLGALSCVLVLWLCQRMNIVDPESYPHHLARRMPGYWLGLLRDTLQSNWDVSLIIVRGRQVRPVTEYVATPLQHDVTRAILANSITLTPGTLTLDVEDRRLRVHALTPELMQELRSCGMIERAVRLEE